MPTVFNMLPSMTLPITPITALSFSNWIVTAGSSRFTCPALMALISAGGSASESTFKPTDKAVRGLTLLMASCIRSVSVQSCSSPNVSKRKIDCPSELLCDWPCAMADVSTAMAMADAEKMYRNMAGSLLVSSPLPLIRSWRLDAHRRFPVAICCDWSTTYELMNITGRRNSPCLLLGFLGGRLLQTAVIRAQPFTRCAAVSRRHTQFFNPRIPCWLGEWRCPRMYTCLQGRDPAH